MKIVGLDDIKLKYGLNNENPVDDKVENCKAYRCKDSSDGCEYSIDEFDKAKTRVLKYVIYKKRTENEIRVKFAKDIAKDILEDVIEELKATRIYK